MADALNQLLEQYFVQAQAAYEKEDFQESYKICLKVLEMDNENTDFLKLKEKIENAVQNYNIHLIDKEIKKFEPLWKEEKYEELVNNLQQLFKSVPHYQKLEKLLAKAEEKYREQSAKSRENSLKNYIKYLKDLLEKNEFGQIIEKINDTEKHFSKEENLRKIHLEIKDKIIKKKLDQKKTLMESEKYEEIVNFLYQLHYVHPASKKLEKLLRKYRKKLLEQQLENKQDFIFRTKENIQNLILLGKFEFAIAACKELISIDPKNIFARKILLSSEEKLKKLLRETMYRQITENLAVLKKEFRENPAGFVKI